MVTVGPIMMSVFLLVVAAKVCVVSGGIMGSYLFFDTSCNCVFFWMIELSPRSLDFADCVKVKDSRDQSDHSVGPVPTSLPVSITGSGECLIYSGVEGHTETEHENHSSISMGRFGWDAGPGTTSGHNIASSGHGDGNQTYDTGIEEEPDQVDEEGVIDSAIEVEEEVNGPDYGSKETEDEVTDDNPKLSITTAMTFSLRIVDQTPNEATEVHEDDDQDEIDTPVGNDG